MQVKIFTNTDVTALETDVNSFLSGLTATTVTIQYATMIKQYSVSFGMQMEYSVMISYE